MPPKLGGLGSIGKKPSKQTQLFPYLEEREEVKPKPTIPITTSSFKNLSLQENNNEAFIKEQVKVLKDLTKVVSGLSDKTIEGFSSVIDKLNSIVPPYEQQKEIDESFNLMLENIDDSISPSDVYVLIPGQQHETVSKESLIKLLNDKNIRVIGSIREIAAHASPKSHKVLFSQAYEAEDDDDDE